MCYSQPLTNDILIEHTNVLSLSPAIIANCIPRNMLIKNSICLINFFSTYSFTVMHHIFVP